MPVGVKEYDCRLLGVEDSEAILDGIFGKSHYILLHCRRRTCSLSGFFAVLKIFIV